MHSPVTKFCEGLYVDDETLTAARQRSTDLGLRAISPATGALLTVLAASSRAQAAVEIGTNAGVSGVYLLRGLREDAVLTSIDADSEHLKAARATFKEAGFTSGRTRPIMGRPSDVLPRLAEAAYDFVFLNADVFGYPSYLEHIIRILRPGGSLVLNNALNGDKIADPTNRERETVLIRQIVRALRHDERLCASAVVPLSDGLMIATKAARAEL